MYELFKLVRLISVKDTVPVTITKYAWQQSGESSLLALACTNGFVVLRYSSGGLAPVVKQLPWPTDQPIRSMCFDPTVSWLLIQTENGNIFILPALYMLDPGSQVNQLWRLDDVTIITNLKPQGTPTITLWWQTLDAQQIAITATDQGHILFLNLLTKRVAKDTRVEVHIRNLELVHDDQQMMTHLLITAKSGEQWKMLLETRSAVVTPPDAELSSLGYDSVDGMVLPIISFLTSGNDDDRFYPMKFYQFSRSVHLSPQYAKGRHFISAHCDKNSTYQIYDSNLDHNPLFVYKLPVGSMKVVLTDRIIFTVSKLAGQQKMIVLSNQRAESSDEEHQEFNKDAVLQQFEFPSEEKLLDILPKSFPFYWHEKLEEQELKLLGHQEEEVKTGTETKQTGSSNTKVLSALGIMLSSHTVLDGCVIVTNSTVYECRPRISPERLFLELSIKVSDASLAEQLGISLSLDLNFLFEMAADFLLSHGNSKQASRLFHMSKGSPVKRVSSFVRYGFIQEIMPFLQQLLSKNNPDVSIEERKQLADLALHGLIYRLSLDKQNDEMISKLREFLINNFDYDDKKALKLLAELGLEILFLEFAMSRGLVFEALHVLHQLGQYKLGKAAVSLLINKGFGVHLAQAASGSFLHCLDIGTIVTIFCEKPQLVAMHSDLLLGNLSNLDLESLLQVAEALDPSKPVIQGYIQRKLHSRRRTSSMTSITSTTTELGDSNMMKDGLDIDVNTMVHCFLMTVLYLNKIRQEKGEPVNTDFLFTHPDDLVQHLKESFSMSGHHVLPLKPSPVGCGQCHAAVVIRGEVYTWGKTEQGRLGHSEKSGTQQVSGPCKVSTFSMLQIRVISVSCGLEHTVALTQQGIYGWGSSKYGQVGLGTKHVYARPMLIEELSKLNVVSIDCGHYHTLAVTDEAKVYSWGWGVHGQLGHGDTEERLVPKMIEAFENQTIVKVKAGHGHSLALNSQGELFAFGCSFFGQLGLGTTTKETTPVKVKTLTEKVITMDTKYFHCLALCRKGRVYQWGSHPHGLRHFVHSQRRSRQSGQAAFEMTDSHLRPRLIDTSYVHGKIKQVICGSFHSCIQTVEGDVYTWGRNLDGQCGNGTRQDVRIPQMVTTINDRQVNHIDSGGEFNVALDSDGQLWVWGRNEFGQLGLGGGDMKMSTKIARPSPSKNISQQVTEVLVPMHLVLGYQMGSSFTDTFTVAETVDLNSLVIRDDDIEEVAYPLTLPSLHKVSDIPYDRMVIPVFLQCLPKVCDVNQLLRMCVDMKDWYLATSVNLYLQNYMQALGFHLMSLRETNSPNECDVNESVKVVKHYYSLLFEKEYESSELQEYPIRNFLYQVLYHWEAASLPVSDLEACLDSTLPETASLLAPIIFRKEKHKDGTVNKTPSLYNPTPSFLKRFSTKFCLKVCSSVIQAVNGDMGRSKPLSYTFLKELGGDNFDSIPNIMLEGDKLPYDQLWQDIIQNLQKGRDSKQYIYVSHSELDRLEEQLHYYNDGPSGQKVSTVFFTCGHYYTQSSFKKELERMEKSLNSQDSRHRESVSVIVEYYSREGCMPLACPKCVFSVVTNMV